MQPVDYTTITAVCAQLETEWVPARIEQVYQRDRYTIALSLRTLKHRGWLDIAWHPQAARICLGDAPPRTPDTFTFSDQLRHQLKGFALTHIGLVQPWERVVDLQFARRPGEKPIWHLYVEIMAKYSNVILTNNQQQIVTVAHQVSSSQSSLRPLQTGQKYELPPALTGAIPDLSESYESWQKKVGLIPGAISRQLLQVYRGLSPKLVNSLLQQAQIDPQQATNQLSPLDWQKLFQAWQEWLTILQEQAFTPSWTSQGYSVLPWQVSTQGPDIHTLLNNYYTEELNRQAFQQGKQQLQQKLNSLLKKLKTKGENFAKRILEAQGADEYLYQGNLLMANLQHWQPGMHQITLPDFTTQEPITIKLNPEKNAVQNAQSLYKQHQKLKRATEAVTPLWEQNLAEIEYLEQVAVNLEQLAKYDTKMDLLALEEIRAELIAGKYLKSPAQETPQASESEPYCYTTPSGFQLWIGRNNRQNERITFRLAGDYDLWFHTQEIPGSHALLRLDPGAVASEQDLQFTADLTAYYSKARESDQAPVVYTQPKYVYKPKGAQPGMAIYKKEQVIWGRPQVARAFVEKT